MGIRIEKSLASIPVEIIEGDCRVSLGNAEYKFHIQALEKYTFEKQCLQFLNKNVMAFLRNDKFGVVLRYDGTGSLYLLEDRILVKCFVFEPFDFGEVTIKNFGFIKDRFSIWRSLALYYMEKGCFCLTEGREISVMLPADWRVGDKFTLDRFDSVCGGSFVIVRDKLLAIYNENKNVEIDGTVYTSPAILL